MIFREPLPHSFLKNVLKRLNYLSYPTRLRILQFLDAYGQKTTQEIREKTGICYPYISRAFRVLRKNNIILTTKKGNIIFLYQLNDPLISEILLCLNRVFGAVSNDFRYVIDTEYKNLPPKEFSYMLAKQIRFMANTENLKILDFLYTNGRSPLEYIAEAVGKSTTSTLDCLKYLEEKDMIESDFNKKHLLYKISNGVHKYIFQSVHQYYSSLESKEDF